MDVAASGTDERGNDPRALADSNSERSRPGGAEPAERSLERIPLGQLFAHRITAEDAVDAIIELARSGRGGYVVTPNVDHVCVAAKHDGFRNAHRSASLSLVDGTPLLWLAKACGTPFPQKVSGSDLIEPVCRAAAANGMKVAMFGASDKASSKAYHELQRRIPGLEIVARVCPRFVPGGVDPAADAEIRTAIAGVRAAAPDLMFVAMGTPNQELFMHEFRDVLAPTLLCGIGAGFDFLAAERRRAPAWIQRLGLEWLVRLLQEPKRLWRRYLVRDRAIFQIALTQIHAHRAGAKAVR